MAENGPRIQGAALFQDHAVPMHKMPPPRQPVTGPGKVSVSSFSWLIHEMRNLPVARWRIEDFSECAKAR